jgi:hypothetical protein
MQQTRVAAATTVIVALAGISGWLLAAETRGAVPSRDFTPRKPVTAVLVGSDALADRRALIERAAVTTTRSPSWTALPDTVECRYLRDEPSGTTAKFDCVMEGGEVVKVKYNRNAEIHAEVAATRLLTRLGYPTDRMDIVSRVRCYGCPRYPFFTAQLLALTSTNALLGERGVESGFTDFEWVAVERKFPASAIESETLKGWGWFELARSTAAPDELDALRLAAVFLAHWDNKSDNQRLVCLDDDGALPCAEPLAMIQDLGATFGPTKVNLARWHALPIWSDRAQCEVTMRHLPWQGATFGTMRISEEGRLRLARRLASLGDAEIRALFAEARFPDFYAGTDDNRDLAAWTAAFRHRVDQIAGGPPCPTAASPTLRRSNVPSG